MSEMDQVLKDQKKYMARSGEVSYVKKGFARGQGAELIDYDGKRYIDMLSSASSANLGHGNAEIAEAVYEQMSNISQYTYAYFPMREPIDLAKRLSQMVQTETAGLIGDTGENFKVAYSATASASIDGAIKFARGFTGRPYLLSHIDNYHGSTYGAISLSAVSLNMRRKIGPLLPGVFHFDFPNLYRKPTGLTDSEYVEQCLAQITKAFNSFLPPEEVAAFFIEPIQGDSGIVVPPVEYLTGLYKLLKEYGILLVSDETQQALGRTGKLFALSHFGIQADLYVMGKSLGAGLPMGAVVGKASAMDSLSAPAHLFTLGGTSSVAAGALKALDIYQREQIFQQSTEKGEYMLGKLRELQEQHPTIGDVRGIGLSIGVELVKDRTTKEKNYEAAAKISWYTMQKGLLFTFVGQSVMRVQPPLVITYEQIDKA
ncbi:MAG: aminotransferase class III-fold pyridoxal phosphate-dependent enzyme, partial [Bifidobacteriaceae bacterium]|nr:aminotransferase class III-fold pyridoxal phosphate-dependent enzyme [Bifidobacteriaceae bacterium]